jgi:hypothetical protein
MKMEILVKRIFKGSYTIGHMYIDDAYFCDTLEDKVRIVNNDCSMKVYGETAIPEGYYKVEMMWWNKHQNWYPHIMNVPCFEGILIHSGTVIEDTQGCILVGRNKEKGKVVGGMLCMDRLREILKDQKDINIKIE